MGFFFFCSVHCKLEQLNYSSRVAVIKYGDRPRDAESTELPGLLRLRLGAMVKAAQTRVLILQHHLQGGYLPRAGSSCDDYTPVGKMKIRAVLCPSNNAEQSQHPWEAALWKPCVVSILLSFFRLLVKSRLEPQVKKMGWRQEAGTGRGAAHQKAHAPFGKTAQGEDRVEGSRRYRW